MVLPLVEKLYIGIKYASPLNEAKRIAYQVIDENLPLEERELAKKYFKTSRAIDFIGLQTLGIYKPNLEDGSAPLIKNTEMTAYNMIIYGKGTILDQFQDTHLTRHLAERSRLDVEKAMKLVRDENFLLHLAKLQVPTYDEEIGEKVDPFIQLKTALDLGTLYEKFLDPYPKILKVYEDYKDRVLEPQSIDIIIGAFLRQNKPRKVVKLIDEYFDGNILSLTDKLALIAGGIVHITNPIAGNENKKHPIEMTTNPLSKYYRGVTRFSQMAIDDIGRIKKDIEEKCGNILLLDMIYHSQEGIEVTEENFREYITSQYRKGREVISEFLLPPIEDAIEGLKELKEINFGYNDHKLSLNLMLKLGLSKCEKFYREFNIEDDWYNEAMNLISKELGK